jgi:dipeptidyl aminopeptidase/acylaminoacyl peptidase
MLRRYFSVMLVTAVLFLSISASGCGGRAEEPVAGSFPVLTGDYFGQTPPGDEPELFAPGLISTALFTRDVAIPPDGNELYFSAIVGMYNITQILCTKRVDGVWTKPEVVTFSGNPDYMDVEPAFSPDGKRLLFLSNRPDTVRGTPEGQNIWAVDRAGDGWGEPYNIGPPVNSEAAEFFPSFTNDGTLYFTRTAEGRTDIYRSRLVDGAYAEPERLPDEVNSTSVQYNAFIARDESYLILCTGGREDCLGGDDYYICFRNDQDEWTEPINMGEKVNTTGGREHSPYVSPDGKYFFFMSARTLDGEGHESRMTRDLMLKMHGEPGGGQAGIYWMDASFIETLRP